MNQAVELKTTQPAEEDAASVIVMEFDPSDERQQRIAAAAYYKAEARGFESGYELEDWLAAETELGESA